MIGQSSTAAGYHRVTSYVRHQLSPHALDWTHQPMPVKRYPPLSRFSLDRDVALPEVDFVDLVHTDQNAGSHPLDHLDHRTVSRFLKLTHAVTARRMHAGQSFYYRSAASAGALYPNELYLGVGHVDGLDPGLYYHDLFDASLIALRQDPVPAIPMPDRPVAATVYISGIFFRSAWKYRSRAYRYVLLDAGHLLENLRLALHALRIPFSVHLDFDDDRAALLLGLDADREVCLACVHLYTATAKRRGPLSEHPAPLNADICRASSVSDGEVVYAPILDVHRAGRSCIDEGAQPSAATSYLETPQAWTGIDVPDQRPTSDYVEMLWKRRSRRNFIPVFEDRDRFMVFADLMAACSRRESGMPPCCTASLAIGLIVGAHMPVDPGFYILDPSRGRLGQIFEGDLMAPMAAACLDQMWLKHSGLQVVFITDPGVLDRDWGARGYRYAMIEAGRLGQQAYLAATAMEWGACGIGAIYDREAAELLRLPSGRQLLYLVGVGAVKSR